MTKDEVKKQFKVLTGPALAKVLNQYFQENYKRPAQKKFNPNEYVGIASTPDKNKEDIVKAAEEIFNAPEPQQPAQLPITP